MSETKADTPPAGPKAPDVQPPEAAKAAVPAKPAEAKPAPAPAPAAPPAAPKAPEAKAPELPKPGTVGVRAPAPKAPESGVSITITAKAAVVLISGLSVLVLLLGATTLFLLVRSRDHNGLAYVEDQREGMEGKGYKGKKKESGPKEADPDPVAEEKPPAPEPVENVEIGVKFKEDFGGKPGGPTGSWPHFRGPNYDNTVTGIKLANKWPASGPPIKWTLSLGEGYSGPAVLGGRMYIQDYDTKTGEESLRCLSLEDAKEIWRRSHPLKISNSHGFTRTVPAVTEKYAVMMGSKCHVMCVDALSGALKWGIDLMKEYGTVNPNWYTAQCPVIDGNTVILAPAGKEVLLMGVDLETGKVVWKTPNPKELTMSHSSVSIMTLLGKKMYVYCAEWGKMVGVSAEPADVGTLLWDIQCLQQQTMSPAPVAVDDSKIFMTSGVRAGGVLVQISKAGEKFKAEVAYELDHKDSFSTEQQTPILYKKHLYGLMPEISGGHKKQFACMNPFDKGKIVWESGKTKRFGQWEAILLADDKFYILSEDSRLTMIKASTEKYEELGQCKVLQGHEAWAPMVLIGERLLLRDSKQMVCVDIGKGIE